MTATPQPHMPLQDRRIALAVTGSVAAYKAAMLASLLTQQGAQVRCILTRSAQRFIAPATFAALTRNPTMTDMYAAHGEPPQDHLQIAQWAELLIIAPATANTIAKIALGIADDEVTTVALSAQQPGIIAPAMESGMHQHHAVQRNIEELRARGWTLAGPAEGRLASGQSGAGRMLEPAELSGIARWALGRHGDLAGKRIVVTAGGTREPLDAVRFIANASSGKMGHAVAEAARDRGAEVTLISAPTALPPPPMIARLDTATMQQMKDAVLESVKDAHLLVMTAAVSDFRPAKPAPQKLERGANLSIELAANEDILAAASGKNLLKIGFAAQTDWSAEKPAAKLERKGLHMIVLNNILEPGAGFGSNFNRAAIIRKDAPQEDLPLMHKDSLAHTILDRAAESWKGDSTT